jgi:CxxC-x17-CxxC domain-containing protein
MKSFSGNNRSERGKDFSKRGGRDSSRDYSSRGGRDSGRDSGGRPSMHQATCDKCGKDCEVPFKPTSGKPIFCSRCFDKNQNEEPKKYGRERSDRSDRSDRNFNSGDSRKRSYDDRDSVIDNKVNETEQLKKELVILNKKLDKILELLTPVLPVKNHQEEYEEEVEEPKLEKKPKKKTVVKKAVAEKAVVKKAVKKK